MIRNLHGVDVQGFEMGRYVEPVEVVQMMRSGGGLGVPPG